MVLRLKRVPAPDTVPCSLLQVMREVGRVAAWRRGLAIIA